MNWCTTAIPICPVWAPHSLVALALQPLFTGRLVFRMPQRLVLVMLALLLPLSYSTANASSYWVNDLVLFEHAHRVAPQNATARNNYAVQLSRIR